MNSNVVQSSGWNFKVLCFIIPVMLQVKGEKPPAPTRGFTAGGGDADNDEDEVDADDKDDDKIDDSLPRTDIRYLYMHKKVGTCTI